jgi:hypothetical protein
LKRTGGIRSVAFGSELGVNGMGSGAAVDCSSDRILNNLNNLNNLRF